LTPPIFCLSVAEPLPGLKRLSETALRKGGIGFQRRGQQQRQSKVVGETLLDVEPSDLIGYGLIPEFIGRLPVVATLQELDRDALVNILVEPKNACQAVPGTVSMEDVELDLRRDALDAIADKAIERKTGARGLQFYSRDRAARHHVPRAFRDQMWSRW